MAAIKICFNLQKSAIFGKPRPLDEEIFGIYHRRGMAVSPDS
jgi:hypothetical protein